jgi:hypothetical protein
MFILTVNNIRQLAKRNYFQMPDNQMIFFGLRGCLPLRDNSSQFKEGHEMEVIPYDHIHARCTLGQYHPEKGIAVFPGSTVPYMDYIRSSLEQGGSGANLLMTGYYANYHKGWHNEGRNTGHRAFRQDGYLPVRRTSDDLNYDNDDRIDYTRPYDNLHAGWCMGVDNDHFSSAGCQVVIGFPQCVKRNDAPDIGPWKIFKENAYAIEQEDFYYMLLTGREAQEVALNQGNKLSVRLRFGSKGELVRTLQTRLKELNYYEGDTDDEFEARTLKALLKFQEDYFGKDADDGIVGPITASALNIDWTSENLNY